MGILELSPKLQGDMGELMFEHYCLRNNYAYIILEEIYNSLTPKNTLVFRFGYHRIPVNIPSEFISEIIRVSRPTNKDDAQPSFVFDYLTITIRKFGYVNNRYIQRYKLVSGSLNWVEIKTGNSKLTKNQKQMINEVKLAVCIFRINTDFPKKIDVTWKIADKKKK